MAASNTPPDGQALNNYENQTPLTLQAIQQNQIAILQAQDGTGIRIDGVLGGLPVAEKNQEYFLVIEEAGDTTPEILGQTQFKISYLCDSKLNVSKPSGDGIALKNVLQNFERQKNAVVRVDQGTVLNNQLAGTHKITAVGSLEPIGRYSDRKRSFRLCYYYEFYSCGTIRSSPWGSSRNLLCLDR